MKSGIDPKVDYVFKKLFGSEEYKPILKAYIAYANEFRHAAEKGQKKARPSRTEVESFIYLTGLFVRLAMMSPLSLGAKLVPKHPDTP